MIRWLHRLFNERHVWRLYRQHGFETMYGAEVVQRGRLKKHIRRRAY